jgi:hypothetical protein
MLGVEEQPCVIRYELVVVRLVYEPPSCENLETDHHPVGFVLPIPASCYYPFV